MIYSEFLIKLFNVKNEGHKEKFSGKTSKAQYQILSNKNSMNFLIKNR